MALLALIFTFTCTPLTRAHSTEIELVDRDNGAYMERY